MGLLYYKAHCSTVNDDTTYGCASREEMVSFINNIDFHMGIETHNGQKNLVVRFTPFPVKYVNYIKKYNPKKPSTVYTTEEKSRGYDNSVRLIRKRDDQVYIQLFRLIKKRYQGSMNVSYRAHPYDGMDNDSGIEEAKNRQNTYGPNQSVRYGDSLGWKQQCIKFKYLITAETARKGYMIILKNMIYDNVNSSYRFLKITYGNLYTNSYNFRYGLVSGIGIGDNIIYCPRNETITNRFLHGLA